LLSAMNIANQCDISYKLSKNQRLQVELALLKMCHLPSVFNLATTPLTVTSATDGGLKKKPDTSTVAPVNGAQASPAVSMVSEAAPVYSAPPKEVVTPSVQVKETITSPAEKPKIVMPSRSTLTPSLTGEVKTQEELLEEEDPYLKGEDKEDFTMDAFLQCWSDFAAFAKKEGKKTLLTVLTAGAPRMLKPYVFEVIVGNMVQENIFRDEKPVMLNYLRSTLKNFTIEVNARVDEQKVVRKPYTAPEKFQHMAARNPQLLELKSRFNLDFD